MIFELMKLMCFGSIFSYPPKKFLILCPPFTKFNLPPSLQPHA